METDIQVNPKFYDIAQKIAEKGGRMYIVGGAVRDALLNQKPHDMDYCITGIDENTLKEITHVSRIQGSSFPVFIIDENEIALRTINLRNVQGEIKKDVENQGV